MGSDGGRIEAERLRVLAGGQPRPGAFVLHWMQRSQRSRENPALEYAVDRANALGLPLLVLFVLAEYPGATAAHYRFMLRGLEATAAELRSRGAAFLLREGDPPALVAARAAEGAALVTCDAGRLRVELGWRRDLAAALARLEDAPPLVEVEAEAVVPPRTASSKEEWSAATFRRRVEPAIPLYLRDLRPGRLRRDARSLGLDGGDGLFAARDAPAKPAYAGDRAHLQRPAFRAGTSAALERFALFLDRDLDRYAGERNDPGRELQSGMSPWLHFGQVSPVALARRVLARGGPGAAAYVEQLVVRRELAANFVLHSPAYDRWEGLPAWARATLEGAAADRREYLYGRSDFEAAATHDPYWNAAQDEMVITGKMHNYMRMYWGKKILEWSASPREAFATALGLNDRYSLDGRDPNGYAGVAWCFGKHDRPWKGRAVYGTIRCMTSGGLRRKFDIEAYLARIEALRASIYPGTDS